MSHHDHDHHNDNHETTATIPFDKKMVKLFEHWINHNTDHAETYREWAKKAKENDMEKITPKSFWKKGKTLMPFWIPMDRAG